MPFSYKNNLFQKTNSFIFFVSVRYIHLNRPIVLWRGQPALLPLVYWA